MRYAALAVLIIYAAAAFFFKDFEPERRTLGLTLAMTLCALVFINVFIRKQRRIRKQERESRHLDLQEDIRIARREMQDSSYGEEQMRKRDEWHRRFERAWLERNASTAREEREDD